MRVLLPRPHGAAWVLLLAACAAGTARLLPDRLSAPATGEAIAAELAAARRLYESGRGRQACEHLEPLRQSYPDVVEIERLRQDVLRGRGRLGLLMFEAERRVQRDPRDADALYLLGRLQTGAEQRRTFERATQLAPDRLWPWLGYAYALRLEAPAAGVELYAQLYERSERHPLVAVAYASALRAVGRLGDAVAVYEHLAATGSDGIGALGLAQTVLHKGGVAERQRAWRELLQALRQRPFDPAVHATIAELLQTGLPDEQVELLLDAMREDPQRTADLVQGGGVAIRVALLQRSGQPHAALVELQRLGVPPRQPVLRRELRRLQLAVGDVAGFLETLAEDVPAALLAEEGNQVRALWRSLLDGPWYDGADPLLPVHAANLAARLRDVGMLAEAERFCGLAAARSGEAAAAVAAVREEVERQLAFENALRRLLYRGYVHGATAGLDEFLAEVRSVSQAILGRDVVSPAARFSVPLVGELLDPAAAGLCLHLARYNRHLVLGRRSGGTVEGLLFTRLSVRDLAPDPAQDLPTRCLEVIGFDRGVRSLSGVLGGDLAGVALLSHYVIDYDAVREWADGIAERRRIVQEDGGAALSDPLPQQLDPYRPLGVAHRLAALSPLQDSELELGVLDVIRHHERRHLVDSFRYLPIEDNLFRGLGLLFSFGLSPAAIEAEMERRAEVAALWLSPHRDITLAHIADFIEETDGGSPHVQGFGRLGRQLVAELQRQGVAAELAAVANWHRVPREALERAAKVLFGGLP